MKGLKYLFKLDKNRNRIRINKTNIKDNPHKIAFLEPIVMPNATII